MKDRVYQIFATVFEIPIEAVKDDISQSNFDKWDSIMHLMLISDLEIEFKTSFEPEEIEHLKSLSDVLEQIAGKI